MQNAAGLDPPFWPLTPLFMFLQNQLGFHWFLPRGSNRTEATPTLILTLIPTTTVERGVDG